MTFQTTKNIKCDEIMGFPMVFPMVFKFSVFVFQQAVSWLDYSWDLRRTKTCIGTPYGEQCADLGGESQMGVPYM